MSSRLCGDTGGMRRSTRIRTATAAAAACFVATRTTRKSGPVQHVILFQVLVHCMASYLNHSRCLCDWTAKEKASAVKDRNPVKETNTKRTTKPQSKHHAKQSCILRLAQHRVWGRPPCPQEWSPQPSGLPRQNGQVKNNGLAGSSRQALHARCSCESQLPVCCNMKHSQLRFSELQNHDG